MKRFLFLLPAIVAGGLAGWGVSRLVPAEKSAPAAAVNAIPPVRQPAPPATPLSALADARFPAPAVPDDPVKAKLRLVELSAAGQSPVRSALQAEVFRSILNPAGAISDCFLTDENAPGALESIARLARSDPKQALFLVNEEAAWKKISASHADSLRRRIFQEWVRKDPQAALETVLGGGGALASSLSSLEKGANLRALLGEWAVVDPVAAGRALNRLPDAGPGCSRPDFAELIFAKWLEKDAAAAKEWAATQDAETRKKLDAVAAEKAAEDPAAKAAVALSSPETRGDFRAISAITDWLRTDPTAAMTKLLSLPESDPFWERDAANVAEHWAVMGSVTGEKLEDHLSALLDATPDGPRREALLKGLAAYGASNDIPFACRMVEQMAEGRPKDEAMSGLAEQWMRKDPVTLSEWLMKQPATPSRHAAVSRFAELLAKSDPDAAKRWADTVPNDFWQKESVLKAIRSAGPAR